MKALGNCLLAFVLWLGIAAATTAQDEMMPMGPSEEMEQLDFLVGSWVGDMQWRMTDTSSEWMPSETKVTYTKILDGGIIKGDWTMEMMGMTVTGISLDGFDRKTKKFQTLWTDSMLPRMRIYTGTLDGNTITAYGEEIMEGRTVPTRTIIKLVSDTEFEWTMEHSNDGGETWWASGKATYTKQ